MLKDYADNTGPRLPWAGKKVHLREADIELSRLWRMSADNVRISQNINVRTSVLNLVICAPDTVSAQQASMLIRDLSSTHIARVILLILDTSELPSSISTWVTLRSFPIISDLMRHHFEQITILASGTAASSADQIIRPLFKPDLPVYLWWLPDLPTSPDILQRLGSLCNRVIVDSSNFTRPADSMGTLSALIEASPDCAVSDLNWARLTPWRELIAQFFDGIEYRPYITGVNQITIEHGVAASSEILNHTTPAAQGISSNPLQALLLAAWLKGRLGWTHTAGEEANLNDSDTYTYSWQMTRPTSALGTRTARSKSGKLKFSAPSLITLRARTTSGTLVGSICLVRLDSIRDDNRRASFHINRDDDRHVTTSVELDQGNRPPRTVCLAAEPNVSTLLHNELEITGHDTQYEETLNEVFNLIAE